MAARLGEGARLRLDGFRGRALLSALGSWPRLARAGARRVGRGGARVLPDLVAIGFLLATVAQVFRDAWQDGLVFHEADTSTMFYPVFATLDGALARGERLLWLPEMFTGFPLLAEGQTGVLYPPHWIAAALFPTEEGFIWLRIGQFALAVLFAYGFGRSLRLSPGPAAILALSFTFGSFLVGQMQHGSVLASAIWLPLVLALTELGFRGHGLARMRLLLLAGLTLGVSALGVHMQTVIIAGGGFVGWVLFRLVLPPGRAARDEGRARKAVSRQQAREWHRRSDRLLRRLPLPAAARAWRPLRTLLWRFDPPNLAREARRSVRGVAARLGVAAWTAALVPVVGMAVAAPQLLTLYELSGQSGRAFGWTYREATDYSLPVVNLLTLIFPFFFRDGQGGGWSLWQPWEVTYYAGVVPLALAALGATCARRREVLFFLPLVAVATLLALGDYSPMNLYAQVWTWPGINLQRAPARFTFLGVLGLAGLAGLGAQVLWERLRAWPSGARPALRAVAVWMACLLGALVALVWHLVTWRAWLEAEPLWALRYLEESYLSLRRDPGAVDSVQQVYGGLWQALDLTNRHTALPLLLLAALLVLVVCWSEFRRVRPLWQALLVGLVAVDLASFAHDFHPLVPIEEVADVGPAGRFLTAQDGLFRVYTEPTVREPKPNKLLPWGVAEARAYDPLELSRNRVLLGSANYVDNWLFDLLGIRYRVLPADGPGLPSYRQTAFNPQHPLVSGSAVNPSGREVWQIGDEPGDELRVVSVLEDAHAIRDGEPVAEWVLTDSAGRERTLTMVAGRDTAEWLYDDPRLPIAPSHARARVAFTFELPGPLEIGGRLVNLYYTVFMLEGRPSIRRAEFRYIHPIGRMQVYGFGLFQREQAHVAQFFEREKYRTVFQEAGVLIQENRAAFPRAFAVPDAIVVPDAEAAIELLARGPIRPRRQVVLENPTMEAAAGDRALPPPGGGDRLGHPYGEVRVVEYGDTRVGLEATTDGGYVVLGDAYYPGWRAYLDGVETPIYRADYLFRAVEVPPGRHRVEFRYEPVSFESGLTIARLAVALVGLALLVSFAPRAAVDRPAWLRMP